MPSPLQIIKQTQSSLSIVGRELREFREARDELNRQLKNARARASRKEKSPYLKKFAENVIKKVKEQAPTIMKRAVDLAISGSAEFDRTVYKSALYLASDDKDIYKLIPRGSGASLRLTVEIVFQQAAGTTHDYARGISAYRDTIGVRGLDDEDAGQRATEWWKEKVYSNSGLYHKTILGRITKSKRVAPFWQILDAGSTSLPSDRPGTYNPVSQKPTGFVKDAEESISREFNTEYLPEAHNWLKEVADLNEFLHNTAKERDRASNKIKELNVESSQNSDIYKSFGDLIEFVDKNKVDEALRRYRAGEEFERVYVSRTKASRRVYLTKRRVEGLLD